MKNEIRFLDHFQEQIYEIPFRIRKRSDRNFYIRLESFDEEVLSLFQFFLIANMSVGDSYEECMTVVINRETLENHNVPRRLHKYLIQLLKDRGIIYQYHYSTYIINPFHFHILPDKALDGFFNKMYRIKQTKNITLCMQTLRSSKS